MQEWPTNPTSPFWRYGERRTPGLRDYFLAQVERAVIPNLRRLLDFFRMHRLRVIHTTIASELPDGEDWIPTLRRTNAVAREEIGEAVFPSRTDRWARIVEALTPRPGEVVINKTTYSAFTSSGLAVLLRNLRIETLVLGGIITNRCVETTAREATDRGYRVILLEDASATYSPELQEATMLSLQGSYGYVRMTDEVLALLEQALPVGTLQT
jgi:nicotinamidase-related amidase